MGRPLLRALRAAVFAAACVPTSASLHVLAGGAEVRTGVLALALALAWAGAYALGGRRRGRAVLLAACFAAQYGAHHLFTAGAAPAPSLTEPSLPLPAGHTHGSALGMLVIHTVVALGSSWWLERGESALATLLHLAVTSVTGLWRLVAGLLAPSLVAERTVRLVPWAGAVRLAHASLAVVVSRRGPPAASPFTGRA
ncbi:hypothetical protein [Sphaerisporangium sp. TRM90804]|uniref:hypothetical protein n=1 Tax=Sphaerisporangium sp. TRM90804 TaxID=3031113 RepID=UPI00244AC33B|nr:hypothetical protein [Sphaerisporangium sp. TRM90804]MDH2428068.1 hypothetical protein [Sphaerisporangium sp. TRM90804]